MTYGHLFLFKIYPKNTNKLYINNIIKMNLNFVNIIFVNVDPNEKRSLNVGMNYLKVFT